jgi:hypothetical protein
MNSIDSYAYRMPIAPPPGMEFGEEVATDSGADDDERSGAVTAQMSE